jgi:hypothetical protein
VIITGAKINFTIFHNEKVFHKISFNDHNISQNTHININAGEAAIKTRKTPILTTNITANHINGATNNMKNTNLNKREIKVSIY